VSTVLLVFTTGVSKFGSVCLSQVVTHNTLPAKSLERCAREPSAGSNKTIKLFYQAFEAIACLRLSHLEGPVGLSSLLDACLAAAASSIIFSGVLVSGRGE